MFTDFCSEVDHLVQITSLVVIAVIPFRLKQFEILLQKQNCICPLFKLCKLQNQKATTHIKPF